MMWCSYTDQSVPHFTGRPTVECESSNSRQLLQPAEFRLIGVKGSKTPADLILYAISGGLGGFIARYGFDFARPRNQQRMCLDNIPGALDCNAKQAVLIAFACSPELLQTFIQTGFSPLFGPNSDQYFTPDVRDHVTRLLTPCAFSQAYAATLSPNRWCQLAHLLTIPKTDYLGFPTDKSLGPQHPTARTDSTPFHNTRRHILSSMARVRLGDRSGAHLLRLMTGRDPGCDKMFFNRNALYSQETPSYASNYDDIGNIQAAAMVVATVAAAQQQQPCVMKLVHIRCSEFIGTNLYLNCSTSFVGCALPEHPVIHKQLMLSYITFLREHRGLMMTDREAHATAEDMVHQATRMNT